MVFHNFNNRNKTKEIVFSVLHLEKVYMELF